MISTFLQHELKAFWRSKNTGKNVATRIVMGVLVLYLLLNVLVIAFLMDKIIDKAMPEEDMIPAFCSILLYYFLFDLLMRLQLQELPTLRVQPYLTLPVKRNTLVGYLSFTAVLSVFNLWPLILFTPFTFKIIAHENGLTSAFVFVLSILALTVFNNYLALYIKRKSNLNGWIFLAAAALLILVGVADFSWHLYSIRKISGLFFGHIIIQPIWALLPVLLAIAVYYLNFNYLKQNLYLEELGSGKATAYKSSTEIPFLGYFGHTGDLVANEIKLIIRNKRPRSSLIISLFFMFYGFMFYSGPQHQNSPGFKLVPAILMTGIFIINYGQFMFSWQGGHFDGILVSKLNFKEFLRAKYLLFTIVSTLIFILTIPYVYYGWHILLNHFVMYLWNIGVNATIVLFFANRNNKRIDLSKGASFNWEGVGATQMLLGIPLMAGPYLIYWPLSILGHAEIAFVTIGLIGLLFVLTRSYWIKLLEKDFNEKRYTIAEGFRAK